jgi:hypothetical protein
MSVFSVRVVLVVSAIALCGESIAQSPPTISQEQIDHINAQLKQLREQQAAGRTPPQTDTEKKQVNEFLGGMHQVFAASQKKLLYETDHAKLASDARVFAAQHGWGASAPQQTGQVYTGDDPALPPSIRALKPSSVRLFGDRIEIECGGALHHHGISVFRQPIGGHGTKDLGNGVWYYSEGDRMFDGPPPKI